MLNGLLSESPDVRSSCLQVLDEFDISDLRYNNEIWISCHDEVEENAVFARELWQFNEFELPEHFDQQLIKLFTDDLKSLRRPLARSLAHGCIVMPTRRPSALRKIFSLYKLKVIMKYLAIGKTPFT